MVGFIWTITIENMGLLAVIPKGNPRHKLKPFSRLRVHGFLFSSTFKNKFSTLWKTKNPQLSLRVLTFAEKEGFCSNLPHSAFCKCQSLSNKKTVQVNLTVFLFPSLALDRGERGIRTPGGVTLAGFQDQCIRPLCHLSVSRTPRD